VKHGIHLLDRTNTIVYPVLVFEKLRITLVQETNNKQQVTLVLGRAGGEVGEVLPLLCPFVVTHLCFASWSQCH